MTDLINHSIFKKLNTWVPLTNKAKFPKWYYDILGNNHFTVYYREWPCCGICSSLDDSILSVYFNMYFNMEWKLIPKHLSFLGTEKPLPSYLDLILHFVFASCSLAPFPLPLQGATDPLGSLNFCLGLWRVINDGGPGTCWGQRAEHPVCHRQIHPCASTGSLFSSATIIYSSQSTLNHLLFILFSLSIIPLDLLSQGTGEKW